MMALFVGASDAECVPRASGDGLGFRKDAAEARWRLVWLFLRQADNH